MKYIRSKLAKPTQLLICSRADSVFPYSVHFTFDSTRMTIEFIQQGQCRALLYLHQIHRRDPNDQHI